VKKTFRIALLAGVAGGAVLGAGAASAAISGAGATFPRIAYENWCRDSGLCSYTGVGSGAGITRFISGTVDIAGTDATLTETQLASLASARGGVRPLYFPTLLGAITVPVNVPGITGNRVRIPAAALGRIFSGDITNWSDSELAQTPKNLKITKVGGAQKLPNAPITVCVRSDGSGTSFGFSRYLTKVSSDFKTKVNFGQTPPWTAPTIVKSPGNAGVANCVKNNQNSIGYVDLADAAGAGLSTNIAAIGRTQKGKTGRITTYVLPSLKSIQAAQPPAIKPDLTIDFSASPATGAYPIVITTWVLAYSDYAAAGKSGSLAEVKQFLSYAYSKPAQDKLASLNFVPLPAAVVTAAKKQLDALK